MQVLQAKNPGQHSKGGGVSMGVGDGGIRPGDIVHRKRKVIVHPFSLGLSGRLLAEEREISSHVKSY